MYQICLQLSVEQFFRIGWQSMGDTMYTTVNYSWCAFNNSNFRFTTEEKAKRPQACYMPFGYGPRSCIGMRLALFEIKVALIELMKEISFVRSEDTEVHFAIVK